MNKMNTQRPKRNAEKNVLITIGLGILLLGTGPMFVKHVMVDGALVAFYRLLFSGVMLALPAHIRKEETNKQHTRKELILWAALGGLSLGINLALWCSALNYTTASTVTLLDNTAPIWVGLFTWLVLRKKQKRQYWLGLILALGGAFLLVASNSASTGSRQILGNSLGILSGISYAAYILVTQRARQMISSVRYTWLVSVFGAGFLFFFTLATGTIREVLPLRSYVLIFLMSLSSQVIGWYFVNDALGKLPATASSVALVGQPLVTTILGVLVLNEIPTYLQIVGGVVCLIGIIIVQRSFGNANAKQ